MMFVMPNVVPGTSQVFNKIKIIHMVFSEDNWRAVCLKSCFALCRLVWETSQKCPVRESGEED